MNLIDRLCAHYGIGPSQISRLRVRGDEKISLHITLDNGEVRRYRISPSELKPVPEPMPDGDGFVCGACGRAFGTERGLATHQRYCVAGGEEE